MTVVGIVITVDGTVVSCEDKTPNSTDILLGPVWQGLRGFLGHFVDFYTLFHHKRLLGGLL